MSNEWPPPGHSFFYRMEVQLDGFAPYEMDVSIPSAREEVDIATFRVSRHGGPDEGDAAFRDRLYRILGEIVVAGGHVESAMKRLVLLLKGEQGGFSVVDKTWSDLHKMLLAQSRRSIPQAKELSEILSWGEQHDLKRRRDDVVHSSWWDWDGVGVQRSRFYRKMDGASLIGSFEDLKEDAKLLASYAEKLDRLLGPHWPQARLPRRDTP
ncbi:hypothetical protein AB0C86_38910 [Streptomyces lavendulae]|uniref:hypothetical protein n=1 Tax=Streptomyces lavendulae TaxID=1914 RepID=UPI0033F8E83F